MLQVPGILSIMFPTAPIPLWSAILSSYPQCLGTRARFPQQMFFYTYGPPFIRQTFMKLVCAKIVLKWYKYTQKKIVICQIPKSHL